MNKKKQPQPIIFSPYCAQTRKTAIPPQNKKRKASAASSKAVGGNSQVRKPRIAKPRYDLNNVEVQGLFGGSPVFGPGSGAPAASAASSGGDIFAFFKRIGGLDGIISTMSKVQKMYTIMQQMGPIFKLFGSFGGAQVKTKSVKTAGRAKSARHKTKRKQGYHCG